MMSEKSITRQALSLRQQRGEAGSVAKTKLLLAELACDSNQGDAAQQFAQDAVQEFQRENESDSEILALAFLSRAMLKQGKIDEAQGAISKAKVLSTKSSDVATRLVLEVDSAYVLAAAGNSSGAELLARSAFAEAKKLGLVQTQLEASLALGEIQIRDPNSAAGRTVLQQLAKDARSRGFVLVERKASAALARRT